MSADTLPPFQRFLDEHRDAVWRFLVSAVGPAEADERGPVEPPRDDEHPPERVGDSLRRDSAREGDGDRIVRRGGDGDDRGLPLGALDHLVVCLAAATDLDCARRGLLGAPRGERGLHVDQAHFLNALELEPGRTAVVTVGLPAHLRDPGVARDIQPYGRRPSARLAEGLR